MHARTNGRMDTHTYVHTMTHTHTAQQMKMTIEKELRAENLQVVDGTVTKIIQLYETKNSRSVTDYPVPNQLSPNLLTLVLPDCQFEGLML